MACHDAPMPPRMVLTTVASSTVTATSLDDPAAAAGEEKVKSRQTVTVRAAPLWRSGVDVTIIIVTLYGLNDPIQLVWMVSQAGRLTRTARDPCFPFASTAAYGGGRGEGKTGCSWPSPLAYQPDSPTARDGGGPERMSKWRCPTKVRPTTKLRSYFGPDSDSLFGTNPHQNHPPPVNERGKPRLKNAKVLLTPKIANDLPPLHAEVRATWP